MWDEGGGAIESIVIKQKIKRLAIDSISSFSSLFESEQEKRQEIISLFDMIRKWGCTSILTLQKDPFKSKSESTTPTVEYQADSLILLYFIRVKNNRQRLIEILKMRGTNHSTEMHFFRIQKGIKVGKMANLKL